MIFTYNPFDYKNSMRDSAIKNGSFSQSAIVVGDTYYGEDGEFTPRESQKFAHELTDMDEFKWLLLSAFMRPEFYDQEARRFRNKALHHSYYTDWELVDMFHGHQGGSMDRILEHGIIKKEGNWGFFTSNREYARDQYAKGRPDFVISARFLQGAPHLRLESIPFFCTGKNHETEYYLINRLSYGFIRAVTWDRWDMMGIVTQIFDPGCVQYDNLLIPPKWTPSKEECDRVFHEFSAYARIIEKNPVLRKFLK